MNDLLIFQDGSYVVVADAGNQYREGIASKLIEVNKLTNGNDFIADVVCSCYMCGKSIDHPEEQYDMYGEKVCQDCWDYNMHQALQDGGGM